MTTPAPPTTLSDFLLTQLAADEAMALAAMEFPAGIERTVNVGHLRHAPVSDVSEIDGAELDELGHWGWTGGPVLRSEFDNPALWDAFDMTELPDAPYRITEDGLWDEAEEVGASFYRASVPAANGSATARHIANHDPARVLADVAALRAVVALGPSQCSGYADQDQFGAHHYPDPEWSYCDGCSGASDADAVWTAVLRALAQPFRGRDGWQAVWAL